jgi:hypothetical protein
VVVRASKARAAVSAEGSVRSAGIVRVDSVYERPWKSPVSYRNHRRRNESCRRLISSHGKA